MNGTFDLGQILSDTECTGLAGEVIEAYTIHELKLETDDRFYKNSYGGVTKGAWEMLRKFQPLVEEKIGKKVIPQNPYCRIYNNGSTLNKHTDRDGLDWTISVCLYTDVGYEWPLIAQVDHWTEVSFPTIKGYASLVNGGALEHWREPLQCTDEQYVIQMFLHYKEVK